jgi:hypothetical protein
MAQATRQVTMPQQNAISSVPNLGGIGHLSGNGQQVPFVPLGYGSQTGSMYHPQTMRSGSPSPPDIKDDDGDVKPEDESGSHIDDSVREKM